ncbi:MAG: hypothetical protein A3A24_02075 [Candidatus Buchananbacteria bacterium RIFCSPLOWO2_01_FULL_46_12]|uniref:Uncharacterized protein n=1 Tax=Candidatus Buchananbacteria bacterium RIFCSPLOWO2_01_FULL_46_12 TaxID=1797546 RepID=A0A1G1YSM4_9BACT|nr:MAG: hypothetical protein A3A24_02075 [Candidatus Buchananbacteria bacterium RIFCSPLOWO2_01_FULL_46_12]
MKMKSVLAKLSPLFESAIVVLLATIFVVSVTFAATTIGSSITTGGNVTATGWASTTNATTTDYVYVGWGVTAPAGFDYKGDLIVSDDAFINDQATTSKSLWVGSAGTANNLSMSGGDLYVQDDVEIDGDLWLVRATTTDSLYVGGNASTTGDLYVSGGTIDITTSTATTTMGLFVRPKGATSTTTMSIGDQNDHIQGCLEMVRENEYYRCYIDGDKTGIVCALGRCN